MEIYGIHTEGRIYGFWCYDVLSKNIYLSRLLSKMIGVRVENIDRLKSLLFPEDFNKMMSNASRLLHGEAYALRCPVRIRLDGHYQNVFITGTALCNQCGKVWSLSGIVEKSQNSSFMPDNDVPTGLASYYHFRDLLNDNLRAIPPESGNFAVLCFDIDSFQNINDTYGHEFGDRVLIKFGEILKECYYDSKCVARYGNDEFVLALSGNGNIQKIRERNSRFKTVLNSPLEICGQNIYLSASVGIAVSPYDGKDAETLIRNADSAMYEAKATCAGSHVFYNSSINQKITNRMIIEKTLRSAIGNHEFTLFYQPQYNVKTGKIIGMETLLRWISPHGPVLPYGFILVAEETGLILPIGEWVIQTACTQVKKWEKLLSESFTLSINLSARQFRQIDLNRRIQKIIGESGLSPQKIEFEITESAVMEDLGYALKTIRKLNQMGIQVALDDFGTGYSSLNYLSSLPVNRIKIDKGFIKEIVSNPREKMISEFIIKLAHGLNMDVVAEGVENRDQLDILFAQNCDSIQGYYYSKPLPENKAKELIFEDKCFKQ